MVGAFCLDLASIPIRSRLFPADCIQTSMTGTFFKRGGLLAHMSLIPCIIRRFRSRIRAYFALMEIDIAAIGKRTRMHSMPLLSGFWFIPPLLPLLTRLESCAKLRRKVILYR